MTLSVVVWICSYCPVLNSFYMHVCAFSSNSCAYCLKTLIVIVIIIEALPVAILVNIELLSSESVGHIVSTWIMEIPLSLVGSICTYQSSDSMLLARVVGGMHVFRFVCLCLFVWVCTLYFAFKERPQTADQAGACCCSGGRFTGAPSCPVSTSGRWHRIGGE
jgi:hypothetical protein